MSREERRGCQILDTICIRDVASFVTSNHDNRPPVREMDAQWTIFCTKRLIGPQSI